MRQFIVVEGLIGVGKTSLCKLLSETWNGRLVLEPSETNPFLEPFYEDPARFGFPVQMYYLITRWKQQAAIRQEDLFSDLVVSDYLFEKDRLFAEKTLPEVELELYDRFAAALTEKAPTPDLLVFLDAPIETIMKRIAKRNAPGEHRIKPEYLVDLRQRYSRLLSEWTQCPVLMIDNRDMDYLTNPSVRESLLGRIRAALNGEPIPKTPLTSTPASDSASAADEREVQPSLFGSAGSEG